MLASLTVQYLVVAAIVATAVILLCMRASKYFLPAKPGAPCGSSCGGCANNAEKSQSQPQSKLVQLGSRPPD